MSWYKNSQLRYGYHGTSFEFLTHIQTAGLKPVANDIGEMELFFSDNEDDISSYADGLWLRFPFPSNSIPRIGRGSYYTTNQWIPPSNIEYKTSYWDDWKKLI